jgi:putative Mg2+ transporter-C (MgtC) family protein
MADEKIIVFRLLLGAICGGLIGLEREASNRPAGFRTHILVGMGATLIMLVSISSFGDKGDSARLAAQVVSGIGFLGAGTIMKTGNNVRGLTTAASLWVCSAIGLAIGGGYYVGAIVTVIIVLFSLIGVGSIENKLFKGNIRTFEITGKSRPGFVGDIGSVFGKHSIAIQSINMLPTEYENEEDKIEDINFIVKYPHSIDLHRLYRDLYNIKGLHTIIINGEQLTDK